MYLPTKPKYKYKYKYKPSAFHVYVTLKIECVCSHFNVNFETGGGFYYISIERSGNITGYMLHIVKITVYNCFYILCLFQGVIELQIQNTKQRRQNTKSNENSSNQLRFHKLKIAETRQYFIASV